MRIHIGKNGKQEGPYSAEEVLAMLADGRLSANDLAWVSGMPEWIKLGVFLSTKGLVPPDMPPIPGVATPVAPTAASASGRLSPATAMDNESHGVLDGKYGITFLAMFLSGILEGIPGMIPFIGMLLRVIFSPIFQLGLLTYMMKRARTSGVAPEMNDLFAAFKFFGRALGAVWYMVLRLMLWAAGGFVVVVAGLVLLKTNEPAAVALILVGSCALIPVLIVVGYRYALHLYLCLDNLAKPVTECLDESVRLMDGNKWRLFVQQLVILWKPYLLFCVLVVMQAGLVLWAIEAHKKSSGGGEFFMALGGVVLLSLCCVPVLYFLIRAGLRAAVARVLFYDELVWVNRRKG